MTASSNHTGRPRVLQLSYACSPDRGSEYAVGWNRALESAQEFDTWVIIGEYDAAHLEVQRYLEQHGPIEGLTFVSVPPPRMQRWLDRLPGCPYLFGYQAWHRAAFEVARQLHQEWRFDLVHQVNYCGYREPGYLWKLDAPFVWGPVGGTQNYPWRFLTQAGWRGVLREVPRNISNRLQLRFSARVRRAVRRSSVFLTANSTIQRDFAHVLKAPSMQQLETGLRRISQRGPRDAARAGGPIKLLWSGELEPLKALPLLIRALKQLPAGLSCQLTVLGKGSCQSTYQRLAKQLGVDGQIEWAGWLPYHEAVSRTASADLFVFTSLRDTSGNVVLEAMAAGVPVICLDHQGVHDIVTDDCGVRIPVTTPRQVVAQLAATIAELAVDSERRMRLSAGAFRRAENYLWSVQGRRMREVYRRVIAEEYGMSLRRASFMGESFPIVKERKAAGVKGWLNS